MFPRPPDSYHGPKAAEVTQVGEIFVAHMVLPLPIGGTIMRIEIQGIGDAAQARLAPFAGAQEPAAEAR